MKFHGELRDIQTQKVIATSDEFNDAGEAFIRGFVEPMADAPDELYYISKDGKRGLYYCCR